MPGIKVSSINSAICRLIKHPEQFCIATHLEYALAKLQRAFPANLTDAQRLSRQRNLDLLREYIRRGYFPRNYGNPGQRKPCFIDIDGNICAVGYLVAKTAGRELAEKISNEYQYAYLSDIGDSALDEWIARSGLSRKECSLIQPTYAIVTYSSNVEPTYGIGSSLLSGVNMALSVVNVNQLRGRSRNKCFAIGSMATGASQILLGALNYPKEGFHRYGIIAINPNQRRLSMLNLGLGTTCFVLGACNFITGSKVRDKATALNFSAFPAGGKSMVCAFTIKSRF